jgi:S1-C subfamily serine protease
MFSTIHRLIETKKTTRTGLLGALAAAILLAAGPRAAQPVQAATTTATQPARASAAQADQLRSEQATLFAEPARADVYRQAAPSVVLVRADDREGSGVQIAGGILTNAHVVQNATHIDVFTSDSRTAPARVVRIDGAIDLALLRTDLSLPALELEAARQQRVGDDVLVLGYPLGLRERGGPAILTKGTISGILPDDRNGRVLIQTDASVNHGNSGGAMLNLRGKLIGVPTLAIRAYDAQGVNFAIAADSVQMFVSAPQRLYRGDPRRVALTPDDFSDDWSLVEEDTSKLQDGLYVAQYSYQPESKNDLQLILLVVVTPSVADAEALFPKLAERLSAGMTKIPAPGIGDAAYAAGTDGQLLVLARAKNVVLATVAKSDGELCACAPKLVVSALSLMTERVNAQAG